MTHICVIKITIIGSDNGLSPGRRQAIIWINARILLIWNLGTDFNEILSEIHTFSFKKMHFKMSSAQWRLFRLGLNVLTDIRGWISNYIKFKNIFCGEWPTLSMLCTRRRFSVVHPCHNLNGGCRRWGYGMDKHDILLHVDVITYTRHQLNTGLVNICL